MTNKIRIIFSFLVATVLCTTLSANPLQIESSEKSGCVSSSNIAAIQLQKSVTGGGEWKFCEATMEGPDILCEDEDGTFEANLAGNLNKGCDFGLEKIKWSTSFNKNELTPTTGSGPTFKVTVQTDKKRTGTITAKHPCCGEATRDLILNGDLKKPLEKTEIKDVNPDVSAGDFKEQLDEAIGDKIKISSEDRKEIESKVESALKSVADKLPDSWVANLEERAKELVPQVVGKIRGKVQEYNKAVESGINTAANRMETRLNNLTPNVTLRGIYKHRECSCDPGEPGWSEESGDATGTTGLSVTGGVTFQTDIQLSPAGVGITIPVSASAEIKFKVKEFGVRDPTVTISPATDPVATAFGTPHVILSATGKFNTGAGVSITVGGGIRKRYNLPEVEKEIKHNCEDPGSEE